MLACCALAVDSGHAIRKLGPALCQRTCKELYVPVQDMRGRINLMHTDMPYAAFWEADPTPPREHLVYVSGLPAGSRIGDIVPSLEAAGLGRARVHFKSSGTQVCTQLPVPVSEGSRTPPSPLLSL